MNRFLVTVVAIVAAITVVLAQTTEARPGLTAGKPAVQRSAKARTPLVEFEMMTWPEVKQALVDGKTTALFYTGGTEQRGPQNANGGHNLMAKATVKAIALKLGNAIAMPVLSYTPNNASSQLVRRGLLKTAVGDPVPLPGQGGRGQADPNASRRVNNGITGDARRSSAALGKMAFDMKVDYAVKQIRGFLGMTSKPTQPL